MDMVHVRAVGPSELTTPASQTLSENPYVFGLRVVRGAVHNPDGDLIECDVLAGAINDVFARLQEMGFQERGTITVQVIELAAGGTAARTERSRLGRLARAPWWADLDARIESQSHFLFSFYLLLVIAGLIAATGIVTNSQILIVAAMVVGPEYAAIISVSTGLYAHDSGRVWRGLRALARGFSIVVVAVFLFSLLIRGLDEQTKAFTQGVRPVSNLIDSPNFLSVVVAVLAGIVGIVSLAGSRPSALLGVFISVTTIPAAADIGVSCAFQSWSRARGSLLQLLLNVVVLILVGWLTLGVQRWAWARVARSVAMESSGVGD